MYEGSLWVKRELASSALSLAQLEPGIEDAHIDDKYKGGSMVVVRYYYTDKHLRMVVANELNRKIKNLLI